MLLYVLCQIGQKDVISLQFSAKGIDPVSLGTSTVTHNNWLKWKREVSQSNWSNDYNYHSLILLRTESCMYSLI
jgi:hypothetical protein